MKKGVEHSKSKTVVLGITGSIAAYKSPQLVRLLQKRKYIVEIVMTKNACQFISPLTLQTVSQREVFTEMFSPRVDFSPEHISLSERADLVLIAPATANIIGKIASGIADDLLTTVVMATSSPVLIAPAMNYKMYQNPILQNNIRKLKALNYHFIEPAEGELVCGEEGRGRLAELDQIVSAVIQLSKRKKEKEII
jgi:phosphopantothenoylcysteine decarboxylase/phosphopantothenate--cysteine ligase